MPRSPTSRCAPTSATCSPAPTSSTPTQGRIPIAAELRRYAGLTKECVVIGAVNRLEIWDAAAWQAYQERHENDYAQAQGEVLPGMF